MVLVLPPAPAARVLLGLAFAIFSFWSAAALRRMAVLAPPGGVGEEGRAVLAPDDAAGALAGESDLGEACSKSTKESSVRIWSSRTGGGGGGGGRRVLARSPPFARALGLGCWPGSFVLSPVGSSRAPIRGRARRGTQDLPLL